VHGVKPECISWTKRIVVAVNEKKQEELRMLNGTASLSPKEIAITSDAWINVFPDSATLTMQLWSELEQEFKEGKMSKVATLPFKEYELFTRMEQSPNPSSRVFLDTEKDALGVPKANLNWQLTSLEKSSIRKLYELIGQQAGISGVGRVRLMDWLQDEQDNTWPSFLGGG
jgi:hypothetical protein